MESENLSIEQDTFGRIARLVKAERQRQDTKWGEQNHDPFTWHVILVEEIGEVANAIFEERFSLGNQHTTEHIAVELIQSAAVIFAFLDSMHRQELVNLGYLNLDA